MASTTPDENAAKRLIGRRIAAAMARRRMTQTALGVATGRGQGVISDWIKGQRRIGFADAWKVAEALGLTMDALLGRPRSTLEVQAFNEDRTRRIPGDDAEA